MILFIKFLKKIVFLHCYVISLLGLTIKEAAATNNAATTIPAITAVIKEVEEALETTVAQIVGVLEVASEITRLVIRIVTEMAVISGMAAIDMEETERVMGTEISLMLVKD